MVRNSGGATEARFVHVVHGRTFALLAKPPIRFHSVPDNLELGPAATDQRQHGLLRRRFWTSYYRELRLDWPLFGRGEISTAAGLRRSAGRSRRPIALWTDGGWGGSLFLWWAVDGLRSLRRTISMVRPPEKSGFQIATTTGGLVAQLLEAAVPMTRQDRAGGFAAEVPVALPPALCAHHACRRGGNKRGNPRAENASRV